MYYDVNVLYSFNQSPNNGHLEGTRAQDIFPNFQVL